MENEFTQMLKEGFILFIKNDKIDTELPPKFGKITLHFQEGKLTYLEKTETKNNSLLKQSGTSESSILFGVPFML